MTRRSEHQVKSSMDKSVRQFAPTGEPSMTEQHHAKSCDINSIMAKYQKTGLIDHVNKHQGQYGDVSGADFQAAQNLVAEQKTIFHELPADVRDQLDNDVANYLDLVQTDEGVNELRGMLDQEQPNLGQRPAKEPKTAQTAPEEPKQDEAEEKPAVT